MKTVTIHYAADDGKDRTHIVEVEDDGTPVPLDLDEVNHGDGIVMSFASSYPPDYDRMFEAPHWYLAHDLYTGKVAPKALTGYYVQFAGPGGMALYPRPIARVAITKRKASRA